MGRLIAPLIRPLLSSLTISVIGQAAPVMQASYTISLQFSGGDISVETTGAGRLHWVLVGAAGAQAADVVSGVGASAFGHVDTMPGAIGIDMPALQAGVETWFACVLVVSGRVVSPVAEVRVQQGFVSSYATVASVTGSPTVYEYSNAEGNWRAYEWRGDGSFTLSAPGDVDYLMVAGGGGAGGKSYSSGAGGGAGGLLQGQVYLAAGVQELTIGLGGLGGYSTIEAAKGGNTVALGLTAYGGGAADETTAANRNGGSGAGRKAGVATGFGTGVAGQGHNGAGSPNAGGDGAAAGGGGAGGPGQSPSGTAPGSGGLGITSSILGFDKGFAGGGVAATSSATSTATGSHGAAATGATSTNRKGGDGANGTGAGGSGSAAIANTTVNRGGKGGDGVFIIRVKVA